MSKCVAIIGAGPAGLTAAYILVKSNIPVVILERDAQYVGGIARTVKYKDYCFDIGGHRFFSKTKEIEDLWSEILGDDLLTRDRSSSIYYNRQFYRYPLNLKEVISKLGFIESFLCGLSFIKSKLLPFKHPRTFAEWVTNHFGGRLYRIFFKTYTEKVWGISCDTISADWAAQRIKGLSFISALKNALLTTKTNDSGIIKTLINSFRYPRKGPGMLWEACAAKISDKGGQLIMGAEVVACEYQVQEQHWLLSYKTQDQIRQIQASSVISTACLRDLIVHYLPERSLSLQVVEAAQKLNYRDFIIVVLILPDKNIFSENWIYIHDPAVDVGRIQNFKSWSPEMVPDPNMCCYGMEYFCFDKDKLWEMDDRLLIEKAKSELEKIGLGKKEDVLDATVVRQPKAYPVYDQHYKTHVNKIAEELKKCFPSLYAVGRNGMHKYNNQDHSMMTGILAAKNIIANSNVYDPWRVNEDAEYHEESNSSDSTKTFERQVPREVTDV